MNSFGVTLASWADRVRALIVQIRGPDGSPIPDDGVEAWSPPGLRSNPVIRSTTEAAVLELPNGQRFALLIDKGRHDGAVEPETGGTVVQGDTAAVLYFRANGDVEIRAAAGQVVKLQDASQPFVRGTDYADALGTAVDALKVLNTAVGTFATAVGLAVGPVAPAAVTLNTAIGVANTALDVLKAARLTYLSQVVKGQ